MKILDIPRSGSYAGVTSGHNRAGQYVRNRRVPTNNPTLRRTTIRAAMGAASSGYATLTPAQQAAWTAAADGHPVTDRLGSAIKLTGHQLYVSCSVALLNAGGAVSAVAPASFDVFDVSTSVATFGLVAGLQITASESGSADDFLLVGLSAPVSAGRSFWSTYSQFTTSAGDTSPGAITTAAYAARFGAPLVGQKVFVKLTPVNQYGVTGVAKIIPVVVTA